MTSREEKALFAVTAARVKLALGKDAKSVFFATLALRLRPMISEQVATAATDGRRLLVNPEWWLELLVDERLGVLAHEVMHPGLQHHVRRGWRNHRRWNIAADAPINEILLAAGFVLPAGHIIPGEPPLAGAPSGLSAEEYYDFLPEDDAGGDAADAAAETGIPTTADPGGCGAVLDAAADDAGREAAEAEWRAAVAAAEQAASQRGDLPADLERIIRSILHPRVDWREVLRNFVSRTMDARDDYSWARPNRRFVHRGLYLPSLRSESMGEVVITVDTSGSIAPEVLAAFAAELNGVLELRPSRAHIVYCDAAVQRVDVWEPTDGPLEMMAAEGGGGTDHRPIWHWLAESGVDAACVVCLTDGYTVWGDDPGVPVLWALTSDEEPPFGAKIALEK